VTGLVVLLAVHLLTAAFYYIPSAVLSAVVVHAVGDLVTPVATLRQYWAVSPFELLVFLVGVLTSVFKSIETGLYASVALSTAALFYKTIQSGLKGSSTATTNLTEGSGKRRYGTFEDHKNHVEFREYTLDSCPSSHTSTPTRPGVVYHRVPASLDYVTAARFADDLMQSVKTHTKRGSEPQDQSWSTIGGTKQLGQDQLNFPPLRAIVLDFSLVHNIDVTAIQQLFDLQKQLEKYALPDTVEWRFLRVTSEQVRSALHRASIITIRDIEQARL
jgi:sodium-independent sulfate anion transporter 11